MQDIQVPSQSRSNSPGGRPQPTLKKERVRASAACGNCNVRKTKCDASVVGIPCTKCQATQRTNCELIHSKRGRHKRPNSARSASTVTEGRAPSVPTPPFPVMDSSTNSPPATLIPLPPTTSLFDSSSLPPISSIRSTSTVSGSSSAVDSGVGSMPVFDLGGVGALVLPPTGEALKSPAFGPGVSRESVPVSSPEEGSSRTATHSSHQPEEDPSSVSAWASLMTATSNQRARPAGAESVMYLSDSTMTHLLKQNWRHRGEGHNSEQLHFADPGSSGRGDSAAGDSLSANSPSPRLRILPSEAAYLTHLGVFSTPSPTNLAAAIDLYRKVTQPVWPILSEAQLQMMSSSMLDDSSLLLVVAILHVVVTYCDMTLLEGLGFSDRFSALKAFQERGHALHNSTMHHNQFTQVQYLLMMSLVWSSREDSYHLSGRASSLAQALGMNRSTASSILRDTDQRLWRRVWWCCYIRDRYTAVASGRPYRINDAFCDVEMPQHDDFDVPLEWSIFDQTVKLAQILGSVVLAKLSLRDDRDKLRSDAHASLIKWEEDLPRDLQYTGTFKNILVHWLYLSYHCWTMHLIRSSAEYLGDGDASSASSTCVTRLYEDIMQRGLTLQTPQAGIGCLFTAMAQHISDSRSNNETLQQLGRHRLKLLMVAARELSSAHPVVPHVRSLIPSTSPSTPPAAQASGNDPAEVEGTSSITTGFDSWDMAWPLSFGEPQQPLALSGFEFLDQDFQGNGDVTMISDESWRLFEQTLLS